MYYTHKIEEHDAWIRALDEEKVKSGVNTKVSLSPAPEASLSEPAQKKLA